MAGTRVAALSEAGADPAGERKTNHPPRPAPLGLPGPGHVAQGQHLRAAEVIGPSPRLLVEQGRDPFGHLGRGDGLEAEVNRQRGHREALGGLEEQRQEVVELGGPKDRVAAVIAGTVAGDRLFARQLLLVVGQRDGLDADDRHVEKVRCFGYGLEQVPRLGDIAPTEAPGVRRGVDDQFGTRGRFGHPDPGGEVAGVGAGAVPA